ncbi:MAG: papain-like cysteine protease family protein [Burkholderia sp.]
MAGPSRIGKTPGVSSHDLPLSSDPERSGAARSAPSSLKNEGPLAGLASYRQDRETTARDGSPASPAGSFAASSRRESDRLELGGSGVRITPGMIDNGDRPLPRHDGERLTSVPYVQPGQGKDQRIVGISRQRDQKFEAFDLSGNQPRSAGMFDISKDTDGNSVISDPVRLRGGAPGDQYQYSYQTPASYQTNYGESSSSAAYSAGAATGTTAAPAASSAATTYVSLDVPFKRQTKPADCWYACIQMMLSWKNGTTTKPMGNSVQQHRSGIFGRKLAFGSREGGRIMDDNGLVAVGDKLELNDPASMKSLLENHGPIILVGKFDPLRQGHFILLTGVDPASRQVAIQDPGWTGGTQWHPLEYLNRVTRSPGSDNVDTYSAVALAADR